MIKQRIDIQQGLTIEEVNRVLEVGRLLFSVLTEEERDLLINVIHNQNIVEVRSRFESFEAGEKLGNASVT